jgi:hypothetical protein
VAGGRRGGCDLYVRRSLSLLRKTSLQILRSTEILQSHVFYWNLGDFDVENTVNFNGEWTLLTKVSIIRQKQETLLWRNFLAVQRCVKKYLWNVCITAVVRKWHTHTHTHIYIYNNLSVIFNFQSHYVEEMKYWKRIPPPVISLYPSGKMKQPRCSNSRCLEIRNEIF